MERILEEFHFNNVKKFDCLQIFEFTVAFLSGLAYFDIEHAFLPKHRVLRSQLKINKQF